MAEPGAELATFLRGEIDSVCFPHREHVRMGFQTLRRHDFAHAACLYSRALRTMTAKAGKPESRKPFIRRSLSRSSPPSPSA